MQLPPRLAALLCAAVIGCRSTDNQQQTPSTGRAELRAAINRYVVASRTVNADSIAAFYAADGELFEPGIAPIRSADSIRAFMASFPGVVVESATVAPDTIEFHDSTAYVWGEYFERLHFPGQPRSEQRGRFVMQWVRSADAWRIRRYYRIPLSTIVPPR